MVSGRGKDGHRCSFLNLLIIFAVLGNMEQVLRRFFYGRLSHGNLSILQQAYWLALTRAQNAKAVAILLSFDFSNEFFMW